MLFRFVGCCLGTMPVVALFVTYVLVLGFLILVVDRLLGSVDDDDDGDKE